MLATVNLDGFQRPEDDLHQPVSKAVQGGRQGCANTSLGVHPLGGRGQGFPSFISPTEPIRNGK